MLYVAMRNYKNNVFPGTNYIFIRLIVKERRLCGSRNFLSYLLKPLFLPRKRRKKHLKEKILTKSQNLTLDKI
jgi:hypothetical protein